MSKAYNMPINATLQNTLSKLKGIQFHGPEELAEFLKTENVRFSADDLISLGYILVTRYGRYEESFYVPKWLAEVFSALIEGASPKTICDPWAGAGFLIEVLREASKAEKAIALTPNQGEYKLGKVLAPEADWQIGDPLFLLGESKEELDVVASILPMGVKSHHSLKLRLSSGDAVELNDDLGNLVMVAASMRLSSSGIGLFVVTPSFFLSSRSVLRRFGDIGLGIEAAFALPSGTFAPHTNISAYLVVVRRNISSRMFVAQLSTDTNTNLQIIGNFKENVEGASLELGQFVEPSGFKSIEYLRSVDALSLAEKRFGFQAVNLAGLAELKDVKSGIKLGKFGNDFAFQPLENAIYIPLIGNSDVVDSLEALTLKPQNYAQVMIDPTRSNAKFVAHFLNSDFGRQLREQGKTGGTISKLNTQSLRALRVLVPDLATQQRLLEVEAKINAEQTTILALQNELAEFRREIWANPKAAADVERRLKGLANQLSSGIKNHASATLAQWSETLPFPLASILRAWQATPSHDFKTKHEHLLHFFEATAEFVSIILLSAFSSNVAVFAPHRKKLAEVMREQNFSFNRTTFGTWKLVVEYLGKQTRDLLRESGKKPDSAMNDRALCGEMFADPSTSLPTALSRKELAAILTKTNKMRNDWSGHGGVVDQKEAELRNQKLLAEVENLRETIADSWAETHLIYALNCRPRRGLFENEVAILMGSNNEFLKETRSMATWLDVERLYLSKKATGRALKLLPLVQVGPSPPSAKNACYFFSRLEREGARFVSYHFTDKPERTENFEDINDTIKFLSEVQPQI